MVTPSPDPEATHYHQLQCMEVWNGNRFVENLVDAPGMQAWILSQPYRGESRGGDVHYLSLCVGGIVTRVVLADVAGHGEEVAETSRILRKLLRRFMNAKQQNRLVAELNRSFSELEQSGRFATAVIATYLSHKSRVLLTNAGHPRPILYRKSTGRWNYLSPDLVNDHRVGNLPLGIDGDTQYQHFQLSVEPGDRLLFYTDAYTEICDPAGEPLGELGLMGLVEQLPAGTQVEHVGRSLGRLIGTYSGGIPPDDDATLIVFQFNLERRIPGVGERIRGLCRVVGNCFHNP
jgi:serine phosphatase RsbU (regulator of sigma subunit)